MNTPDQLQRFILDNLHIRGEIVRLDASVQEVLQRHKYPEPIQHLLGESLASVVLMSAILKFEGSLTLQAKGSGPLNLLMAEASHRRTVRAIAQWEGKVPESGLQQQLGDAQLAITITPTQGARYQGIVPLTADHLGACIEDYFQQSEQLATALYLFRQGRHFGGILVQKLPQPGQSHHLQHEDDDWSRVTQFLQTLSADEFFQLDNPALLHRLFHEDDLRLFDAEPVEFWCTCSEERTLEMLKTLGRPELESLLAEQGAIEVDCQFCRQQYRFGDEVLDRLFGDPTRH